MRFNPYHESPINLDKGVVMAMRNISVHHEVRELSEDALYLDM